MVWLRIMTEIMGRGITYFFIAVVELLKTSRRRSTPRFHRHLASRWARWKESQTLALSHG